MSIFQNSADLNPLTKIVCAKAWVASTIYRNIVTYSTGKIDHTLLAGANH